MSRKASVDLASTGGARGGSLSLEEAARFGDTAIAVAAKAIAAHRDRPGALLPILHDIQDALGHVPEDCVGLIAENLQRSRAEVHGVLTFYPHFRRAPAVGAVVGVCRAEACQARGANELIRHAQARLGCGFHEASADGEATLEPVYCLGLCAQGPAIEINGERHVHVSPERFDAILERARYGGREA